MKKEIRIVEVCFMGDNSVIGTILHDNDININIHNYCWLVLCNPESLEVAEIQCKALCLDEYIVADRKSMLTSKDK